MASKFPKSARFRSQLLLGTLTALLLGACQSSGTDPQAGDSGKPQSPIAVELVAGEPTALGGTADLTVRAVSRIDLPRLQLQLHVPAEVVVVAGDTSWSGPVTAGTPVEMNATARIPESGAVITATAVYVGPDGQRFGDQATYRVGHSGSIGGIQVEQKNDNGRHRQRFGEDVVEYPVE